MPKDRKKTEPSSSSHGVRFSPYTSNSKNRENCKKDGTEGCDEKGRWREERCTICMEHPHNAVLLICSSHERGCRPYMCRTSRRLSNCLDRFCKLNSVRPSKSTGSDQQPNKFVRCGGKGSPDDDELLCPLCRGQIHGWIVTASARRFMNALARSCPLETCDFSGSYAQLVKHARLAHPEARPSEADKQRLSDWNDAEDVENESGDQEDLDETEEVKFERLRPGDDFFNHIHFGDENDTILDEHYCIENGIFKYFRTTTSGKSYEFAMVLE
ncbi:uncharacterized protein [Coffea arabica]|uniref:Uncharacterized protein n=1 Tax=Coffea arabica TaxID=13443 RepID=A0A6P6XD62_COFAR|nr:uncharacterized protein LOC113741465 [Coffea arabica]